MAGVIKKVQQTHLDELATNRDLKEMGLLMDSKLESLRSEIRINRWMLALVIAVTVLPALKALLKM